MRKMAGAWQPRTLTHFGRLRCEQVGWRIKSDAEIESLVEPVALQTVAAATGEVERGRRARLIGDLYIRTGQKQAAQRWYQKAVGYDRHSYRL